VWDFSTEPEFQDKLNWADRLVSEEIESLEFLYGDVVHPKNPPEPMKSVFDALKSAVKNEGLYACHLSVEQGGQGYGEVNLALLNEVIGRSAWAPHIFATGPGTAGSGQSDVIATYGSESQKQKWLYPLLRGEITSCYSMTEPQAGADPTLFTCRAVRDGDEWVINGDKFFTSGVRGATFIMLMAVTNPDVHPREGMSMFVVPTDTPGVEVLWDFGEPHEPLGSGYHPYVRYRDVRVSDDNLLRPERKAFEMAQRRLSAGRMHHSMRTVARCQRLFDMLCERALSRFSKGSLLAEKQMVQEMISDSWMELTQFRLLVLNTAWVIDTSGHRAARQHIAACKVAAAELQQKMSFRAIHIHGALGTTNAMPFGDSPEWLGIADGPTEVHKVTVARQALRKYGPSGDNWPTQFVPRRLVEARDKLDDILDRRVQSEARRKELLDLLQASRNGRDDLIDKASELLRLTANPDPVPHQ
jgi:acyl-CoA dehydrogenase